VRLYKKSNDLKVKIYLNILKMSLRIQIIVQIIVYIELQMSMKKKCPYIFFRFLEFNNYEKSCITFQVLSIIIEYFIHF